MPRPQPDPPRRAPRRRARAVALLLAACAALLACLAGPLSGALGAASRGSKASPSDSISVSVSEGPSGSSTSPGEGASGKGPPVTVTEPGTSTSTTPTTTSESSTTTSTQTTTTTPAQAPEVVRQRGQQATEGATGTTSTPANATPGTGPTSAPPNNVALPPQVVAAQAGVLAAELAGSAGSVQALSYYRIPLFLLPIYQAAAAQYGVPWQILAAINEVETDYGNNLSVSSAGAVGWMQFMPATWLQYGVDALNAGYADPYNPVDAIFAAARYLKAAGAPSNLRAAILAYNHSAEYVSSVLLRAKLISRYPHAVIATLTGLTNGRLPVRNNRVAWSSTARLGAPSPAAAGSAAAASSVAAASAPPPGAPQSPLLVDLTTSANATVVAVQDGRVVKLGSSRKLGRYLVLRDVYGDQFTYAGLDSIAPSYRLPKAPRLAGASSKSAGATTVPGVTLPGALASSEPAPKQAASAGQKLPLTLHVRPPHRAASRRLAGQSPAGAAPSAEGARSGKVRLFAHPGNPDAQASAAVAHGGKRAPGASGMRPLRAGSLVAKGTVLGHVGMPPGARAGHLRFAIRPAGDRATVDPRPILENWLQLQLALHPQGVRSETDLLGATASGVFLLPKAELQRAVLADPGISIYPCGRQDIGRGAVDRRVLAVLAFLSRSGLKPTVTALRCGHGEFTVAGLLSEHYSGNAIDISAVDGIPIAGHQGPGTITDTTIRTLLTLQGEFTPHQIISLMRYPGTANTLAMPDHWDHIHVGFRPLGPTQGPAAVAAAALRAKRAGKPSPAPSPLLAGSALSSPQWSQLVTHIAGLPAPTVATKPSAAAIRDRKRR